MSSPASLNFLGFLKLSCETDHLLYSLEFLKYLLSLSYSLVVIPSTMLNSSKFSGGLQGF